MSDAFGLDSPVPRLQTDLCDGPIHKADGTQNLEAYDISPQISFLLSDTEWIAKTKLNSRIMKQTSLGPRMRACLAENTLELFHYCCEHVDHQLTSSEMKFTGI